MTTESKVNPDGNPQDKGDQAQGNQDQQVKTQDQTTGSQPLKDDDIVELSEGEKVTFGELKKQRMLEADYRKKTAALAEERRRFEEERQRNEAEIPGPESFNEENVDPLQVIIARQNRIEAVQAKIYLDSEIDKLSSKYPNADKETVFKACWNNPNARIEEEMQRDHERIETVRTSQGDKILTPEREAELKQKGVEEYLAKKKKTVDGGIVTGEGSKIVTDPEKIPDGYDACKEELRQELEEAESGDID